MARKHMKITGSKSGHVEIRFDYENNTDEVIEVGGEEEHVSLPFTMLTGVILPNDFFSNVEVENGRLITEGNNAIVIGYAFPGLYESLKYDDFKENLDEEQREKAEDLDISDHVIITADAKDFELNSTLTVALPDVLEEVSFTDNIDTDKVKDDMDELADASQELIDGTVDLHDGAIDLDDGAGDLNDGAEDLDEGAGNLDDGVGELNDGVDELVDGAEELHDGMIEFNDEGIQKLIDLFGDNVTDMLDRLDAIQKTGSGYQSFSGKRDDMEGSVKFILKTGEIKAED